MIRYKVIDNLLPVDVQDKIIKVVEGLDYPWHFNDNTYMLQKDHPALIFDDTTFTTFQFVNPPDPYQVNDKYLFFILESISKALKFPVNKTIRIKTNMLLKRTESIGKHDVIHVDNDRQQHIVVIYYPNDYDGATRIYEKKIGDDTKLDNYVEVEPKKGRCVIFDGSHFHCASFPETSERRIVVNLNLSFDYEYLLS
jgi:hypothetical protein